MQAPPETRNPAGGNGRAIAKSVSSADNLHEAVTVRQAIRLRQLYAVTFETAATIAQLAFAGCPR